MGSSVLGETGGREVAEINFLLAGFPAALLFETCSHTFQEGRGGEGRGMEWGLQLFCFWFRHCDVPRVRLAAVCTDKRRRD